MNDLAQCPHCGYLSGMYQEGRIERCWICGYWNDPLYPLREPSPEDMTSPFTNARFQGAKTLNEYTGSAEYQRHRRERIKALKEGII